MVAPDRYLVDKVKSDNAKKPLNRADEACVYYLRGDGAPAVLAQAVVMTLIGDQISGNGVRIMESLRAVEMAPFACRLEVGLISAIEDPLPFLRGVQRIMSDRVWMKVEFGADDPTDRDKAMCEFFTLRKFWAMQDRLTVKVGCRGPGAELNALLAELKPLLEEEITSLLPDIQYSASVLFHIAPQKNLVKHLSQDFLENIVVPYAKAALSDVAEKHQSLSGDVIGQVFTDAQYARHSTAASNSSLCESALGVTDGQLRRAPNIGSAQLGGLVCGKMNKTASKHANRLLNSMQAGDAKSDSYAAMAGAKLALAQNKDRACALQKVRADDAQRQCESMAIRATNAAKLNTKRTATTRVEAAAGVAALKAPELQKQFTCWQATFGARFGDHELCWPSLMKASLAADPITKHLDGFVVARFSKKLTYGTLPKGVGPRGDVAEFKIWEHKKRAQLRAVIAFWRWKMAGSTDDRLPAAIKEVKDLGDVAGGSAQAAEEEEEEELNEEEEAGVKRFVALGGQRRLETDKRGRQRTFYVKPKSIERIDTLNGVFGYLDYLEYNKKGY